MAYVSENRCFMVPVLTRSVLALICVIGLGQPLYAIDWERVKSQQVSLFYPGQHSWEWALTTNEHGGAKKFREGKNCRSCHEGEQQTMGAKLLAADAQKPKTADSRSSYLPVQMQIAHDDLNIYFRIKFPGTGDTRSNSAQDKTRVTLMWDDGQVKEATRAGCWGSCHDDAIGMASASADQNLTKYLLASRSKITRQGGADTYKSDAELKQLLAQGVFLEFWQAQLQPQQPVQVSDGYVLEKRQLHQTTAVGAQAQYLDDNWTLVLSRPLRMGLPEYKDIVPGKTYHFGLAIHDASNTHRLHYVSFEYSLILDSGTADFIVLQEPP